MPGSAAPGGARRGARVARVNGREKPALIDAPLFARRAGCGRASRRPGRRRSRIPRPGREADLGQVGVVDVAGEDDDRGRRLAALAASRPRRAARAGRAKELAEGGPVVEVDGAPQLLGRPRAASPPQAPSQTRSFQASRWWKPGESRQGTVVAISRWSKSPLGVLDDPVPLLVVDDRARALARAPGRRGSRRRSPGCRRGRGRSSSGSRRRSRRSRSAHSRSTVGRVLRCRAPARRARLRRAPAARGCRGAGRSSS